MNDVSRVLVVEDEGLVALDLQDRLIKAGYDVPEVATSSEEAVHLAESLNPDLVLMDIRLRGPRDGIDTAQDIHARTPVPIIFVTANADAATLQRARASRPAGFFVKPIPFASLMSSMEMALYRSRSDEYLAFLTGRQIPSEEIVLITDLSGNVEFVSPGLRRLTDAAGTDLLDHPLRSLISLTTPEHDDLALEVLSRLSGRCSVQIPQGLLLTLPGGNLKIPVRGVATLHRFGQDSMRVVWDLKDVSSNDWNEQQIRNEQKMLAQGYIASGMSETVRRLFEMIPVSNEPNAAERAAAVDMVCEAGIEVARALTVKGNENGPIAELVDVNGWITRNAALIRKLVGSQITVAFDLSSEQALVRLPVHSLGQILMSTFESLRRRLGGPGSIQVSSHFVEGQRDFVRLEFRLERTGPAAWTPFVFPFESENSHFELPVANALVTAAGGRLDYVEKWANAARLEILLPRSTNSSIQNNEKEVVLLVSSETHTTTALEKEFECEGKTVIRSVNEAEVLIVARFYKGEIAAVVADIDAVSTHGRERVKRAFLDRNPATKFIWRTLGCRSFDPSKDLA